MSKPRIFKKVINGKTDYWLSLKNIIGKDMPNDMHDILVHIFETKKETVWTRKNVEKRALNFKYKTNEKTGCFEMPTGKVKIIFKNGKIVDLNADDKKDTNH